MTGLVRKATLLTVCGLTLAAICGLMIAGAAQAGVPSAATSSMSTPWPGGGPFSVSTRCVSLVGHNGAATDDHRDFDVTVRDIANNVVAGATVRIEFGACSRYVVAAQASQHAYAGFAAPIVNGATRTVSQVTNALGVAKFRIVGGTCNFPGGNTSGVGTPGAIPAGGNPGDCVHVFADPGGADLGFVKVTAYDQRDTGGARGVDGLDVTQFGTDLFGIPGPFVYHARSDYTCDGSVDGLDATLLGQILFNVPAGVGSTSNWAAAPGWACP